MLSLRPSRTRLISVLTLSALLAPHALLAQDKRVRSSSTTTTRASKTKTTASKQRAQDAAVNRRRLLAMDALTEAAATARALDDAYYRARVQMLAADAMWPADEPTARAIFRRAWEAATVADRREQERLEQESGKAGAGHVVAAREEVLLQATTRDAKFAETFLRELLEEDKRFDAENADAAQPSVEATRCSGCSPWHAASAGALRRLAFAHELLNDGEHARASELAAPLIAEGVSDALMDFLTRLREQNADAADALYVRLLRHTRARLEATDANAVLLLSSYVVSPRALVVVSDAGAPMFRSLARIADTGVHVLPARALAPDVRAIFFDVAAAVLARRAYLAAADPSSKEIAAIYFAIERLLPYVEREAPANAAVMREQRDALAARIETPRRESLANVRGLSSLTQQNPTDPLRPLLDRLTGATSAGERQSLRFSLVISAASRRNWQRARGIAAEIEDADARRAAQTFIAVRQIENLPDAFAEAEENDYESAATFVRNADVPPLARAWGFAQAATLAAQRDKRERAVELLDEAARFAASADGGTRERVAALVVITNTAARFDVRRAWEMLPTVVSAANAFENLHGDEAALDLVRFPSKDDGLDPDFEINANPFRLDELFATMARLDFSRALLEARALKGDIPRSLALVAAARVALETNGRKTVERLDGVKER